MTTNNGSIHSRALLVWLSISAWSARKYDRKVSHEVNQKYAASDDSGRYNKMLLPGDCPTYKALTQLISSIRAQHYAHTLAWSDEGWRLLPTAQYMTYVKWYRDVERQFETLRDSFINDYPMMRQQAQIRLNGLYRHEDYPDTTDLQKKFALGVSYNPIPMSSDVRVSLADDQIADITANIRSRETDAINVAVKDAWQRLHDVTRKISERLNDPEAIFRDSLIENATEVCDVLKRLNVTDDPNLERMRQTVLDKLAQYPPDMLRENKILRANIAHKADDIMRQMSAFYSE